MQSYTPARPFSKVQIVSSAAFVSMTALCILFNRLHPNLERDNNLLYRTLPVSVIVTGGVALCANADRLMNTASNLFYRGKDLVQRGVQRVNELAGMPALNSGPVAAPRKTM